MTVRCTNPVSERADASGTNREARPGRLVAEPELALQLPGRQPGGLSGHEVGAPEPYRQWPPRPMQGRARRQGGLPSARNIHQAGFRASSRQRCNETKRNLIASTDHKRRTPSFCSRVSRLYRRIIDSECRQCSMLV